LDELAALATIRGDTADAARYAAASSLIQAAGVVSDADLGPLVGSPPPGIDPDVLTKLRHMYEAGGWVLVESHIADLPADLRWLFESGVITIRQLAALHQTLGTTSAADLHADLQRGVIRDVPGFDDRLEAAIAEVLPGLRSTVPRIPLGRAVALAAPLIERLRQLPTVAWAEPVGSLRRGEELVGDIEVVAAAARTEGVIAALLDLPDIVRVLHRSERRLYLRFDGAQVGVRCLPPESAGGALLFLTGSRGHFEGLRALAADRGWGLGPGGLDRRDDAPPLAATEDAIYAALGLPTIPPEIRGSGDELDVARRGPLPALVTRADIRGDLHMHTFWSDGRDSIEAMVQACAALGYEYMAITDHSPHSGASRNLTAASVERQADEISGLRERYPGIAILHGCEVDILPSGRLDFSDRILERFDIVLASLHERAGHPPERLLHRYVTAMRHPLVNIITHPTNRLVPHRPGYDLDYDRLFAAAVETGTVLEIDGAPAHLDLDAARARRAVAAGVTVAIDSDGHRTELLERQMALGILTARRGWVEARHVLNTRSLVEVRAAVAGKRSR
jgi:DNA polymerase (family 10)